MPFSHLALPRGRSGAFDSFISGMFQAAARADSRRRVSAGPGRKQKTKRERETSSLSLSLSRSLSISLCVCVCVCVCVSLPLCLSVSLSLCCGRTWLGSATGRLTSAPRLRQNAASVSTFPMCLSRACLDKLISFIYICIYIHRNSSKEKRARCAHPPLVKRSFSQNMPLK
eukprot:COSAG06_NODE_9481_length_1889_cov_3.913408_3_plen_171_part_00